MRDSNMKSKLLAVLARQNPALAALCAAPSLGRDLADAALAQVYAYAPWSQDALAALEAGAPGTRDRYAAAFAQETGMAYDSILDQLNREVAQACPF